MDATAREFTVIGITVILAFIVAAAVLNPSPQLFATQGIISVVISVVGLILTSIHDPDIITAIASVHPQRIMASIIAVTAHHLAATTFTPASVITRTMPLPPSARTSPGVGPRRGAGFARGSVVVLVPIPTSGGDDGRGTGDELATASTTLPAVTITASAISPFTTNPLALPPASSSWAILIDNSGIGDLVIISSLLPITAMVMVISISNGDRGGVSGIPHEVRRIAVHPLPPPTAVGGGSAWRVGDRPTALAKVLLADAPPRPGHPASLLPSSA